MPDVTSPAEGAVFGGGRVTVEAKAERPVTLDIDGNRQPDLSFDADTLPEGKHMLTLRAGGVGANRTILIDRSPPALHPLQAPRVGPGEALDVRLPVRVAVDDPGGVASVKARAGGAEAALAAQGDAWAGELRWSLPADTRTLPVPFELTLTATDELGHAAVLKREGQVTFFPYAVGIAADPGGYRARPLPDGSALLVTGEAVVLLGADGGERYAWTAEGATVAEAAPAPDGGAYVRVLRGGDKPDAEVVRLDATGATKERWHEAGQWPLAVAADAKGAWLLARTDAGPRLRRVLGAESAPIAIEGDYDGLVALGDGVLLWSAAGVEARGPEGKPRWKAAARRLVTVAPLGDAVVLGDADGLRVLDAATGAVRGAAPGEVRVGPDAAVAIAGRRATALGPDGKPLWTAALPAGATVSADGRLAWSGATVMRLADASTLKLEAPITAAVAFPHTTLALIAPKDAPPTAVLVDAAGKVLLREPMRPAARPAYVLELPDGLLIHGFPPAKPTGLLVRLRAAP
jgi:hypothetical protein